MKQEAPLITETPEDLKDDQEDQSEPRKSGELMNYPLGEMLSSKPPVITTIFNGRTIILPISYVTE